MPYYRNTINQKHYKKHTKKAQATGVCSFCALTDDSKEILEVFEHFRLIGNIFPYNKWDGRAVSHHVMLVPKQHTETLAALGDDASIEFVKLISQYENMGYSIYARSPASSMKSVPHQHTHLIKNDGPRFNRLFYMQNLM
jgi:diadenosine tetraphosphate (Ap4A) HIT family hydrolase